MEIGVSPQYGSQGDMGMLQGILFFVYSAAAANMNWGFYPHNAPEVPTAVQAVQSKIFRITIPYYITLSEKEYDVILNAPGMSVETKLATQSCKDEEVPSCIVPLTMIVGTAFLDKSPDHIWTNCHIVNAWMEFVGRNETFSKSSQVRTFFSAKDIPIRLSSTNGDEVYSESEVSTLKTFATRPNFPVVDSGCNSQDDLVKIKLSRKLAESGLPWRQGLYEGPIYMGGFPRPTESRKAMGKMDADGKNFFWTFGDAIEKTGSEAQSYLQQKPNLEISLAGPYLNINFADGVEGMSGSPVLTSEGEVVGIYRGFLPLTAERRDIPFISLYLSTLGMRFVEILSGE